ncbi:hypothetical protein [uncultured Demequina sp.]|uniref:hypothetical protein n=1 Tax=uncultured Demequina sp. TaxID=693499 RepID=UPI0025E63EB8|nr:hypothetical protein [uncultured Demequina sp.]
MPDSQYPEFQGGQTLTASELVLLRTFLHDRDQLLGRLIGFGVNCGLTGSIADRVLTIQPGRAIDQNGEPLTLDDAMEIELPPTPGPGGFEFIDDSVSGYSVVLEMTDEPEPEEECGEAGCAGHAEIRTRGAALRIVRGRVTGDRFMFPSEPLLAVDPLTLSQDSSYVGSFEDLKDAIVDRLETAPGAPLIDTALINDLKGISISSSDLDGVQGYKAAFLNEVLFETLELMRCRALMALSCDRETPRPGVVLGWVHYSGGAWVWNCRYRHAWEPPEGLARAFVGGTCASPCALYVAQLEATIGAYAPPDPPPEPEDPDDDGPIIDVVFVRCPDGSWRPLGECYTIVFPPPEILFPPPHWEEIPEWINPYGPLGPDGPGDPLGPWINPGFDRGVVYPGRELDYLGSGAIGLGPALGHSGPLIQPVLEAAVLETEVAPSVILATKDEIATIPGYQSAGAASPADTIVLVVDGDNRVTSTGRVPAAHTAKQVGTQLPAAVGAATEALDATASLSQEFLTLDSSVSGLGGKVAGLEEFQAATLEWRGGVETTLAGVDGAVHQGIEEVLGGDLDNLKQRVATMEGALQAGTRGPIVVGGAERPDDGFSIKHMGEAIIEFAESVNAGLETISGDNTPLLSRYIKDASRASARLEVALTTDDAEGVGGAVLSVLDTLRTAVKSAGIDDNIGSQIDVQFRMAKDILG